MQILGQSIPNLMSIQRQWIPNPVPICFQFQCKIQYQSRANSSPNRFQSIQPILCQSNIYPKAIFQSSANLIPIKCQSIANLMPIPYWSDVNPRPSWCQSDVNRANPMSIHCQSYSDLVSIQCQSCVDPTPFLSYESSSTIQLIPNPQPIRSQSSANPGPIQHQSSTNLVSI